MHLIDCLFYFFDFILIKYLLVFILCPQIFLYNKEGKFHDFTFIHSAINRAASELNLYLFRCKSKIKYTQSILNE